MHDWWDYEYDYYLGNPVDISKVEKDAASWLAQLAHGTITPAFLKNKIRKIEEELDDAVFFKRSLHEIDQIKHELAVANWALEHGAESTFDTEMKTRLAGYGKEILPKIPPALTPDQAEDEIIRQVKWAYNQYRADLQAAIRHNDPESVVHRLQREIMELGAILNDLETTKSEKIKAGKRKPRR